MATYTWDQVQKAITDNGLFFSDADMALAQKMMQASTKTVHDMLRIPGDDENLGVDEIVKQHNAQYPQNLLQELQQARADVEATEQQIRQYREQLTRITGDKFEQNNRFATVRPKLLSKLRALLQLFPEKQHEYILGLFVDKEYLQRTLQGSMGVVDKVFRSKKILGDFDVLYDEVRKLMDSIGVSTPSAMEIDRELGTRLSDMDDEIKKINSEIEIIVRPENIKISKTPVKPNCISGKIDELVYDGAFTKILIKKDKDIIRENILLTNLSYFMNYSLFQLILNF